MAGWIELASVILSRTGHWQVTIQDSTDILDVDGNDTGLIYTDHVAGGQPWTVLEAKFIVLIDADRSKRIDDEDKKDVVDLVGFEDKLGVK